jgi:hypothetical protein
MPVKKQSTKKQPTETVKTKPNSVQYVSFNVKEDDLRIFSSSEECKKYLVDNYQFYDLEDSVIVFEVTNIFRPSLKSVEFTQSSSKESCDFFCNL